MYELVIGVEQPQCRVRPSLAVLVGHRPLEAAPDVVRHGRSDQKPRRTQRSSFWSRKSAERLSRVVNTISEAASGINKLVDRVLELTHENDA